MKRKLIVLIIISLLVFNNSFATMEKSRQLADEILVMFNMQEFLDKIALQLKAMQKQQLLESQQLSELNLTDEQKNELVEFSNKMTDIIFSEFSWEKMKDEYIKLYTDVYNEEELQQLLDFYRTPVGQKTIQKLPEITQKSMEISQGKMQTIMPKLDQLTKEYREMMRKQAGKK